MNRLVCMSTGLMYSRHQSITYFSSHQNKNKVISSYAKLDIDGIELLFVHTPDLMNFKLSLESKKIFKDLKFNTNCKATKEQIKGFIERDIEMVSYDELRAEAIKDIKFLRSNRKDKNDCDYNAISKYFEYSCMACSECYGMCGTEILINYIRWKFNITKEEAK